MCFHWQEYLGRSEGNIASCSSEGRHFGCRDESQDGSREVHTVRPLCKTTVACAWCEKYTMARLQVAHLQKRSSNLLHGAEG